VLKALKKSFIGSIYRAIRYDINNIKNNFKVCIAALFRFSNAIIYLQTPLHGNVGDLAIAEATLQWLHNNIPDTKVYEMVYGEPTLLHKMMLRVVIRKKDLIILHGGGNLGTWYPAEENYREYVIKKYKNNSIIVFPQSVFFSEDNLQRNFEIGKVYAQHKDLLVCVRDKISLSIAQKYLNCNIQLYPDIVLSYRSEKSENESNCTEVLFCLRNDREKKVTQELKDNIVKIIENDLGLKIKYYDTHIGHHVTLKTRKSTVDDMLNQYKNSALVITDRFHGGIFAYITGTPCIVLEPQDHKVKGGFEWLKRSGNITMPNNIDEIRNEVSRLNNCKEDNVLYEEEFASLKEYILSHLS